MSLKELGKSFVGRTAKYPAAFAVYKFSGRIAQSLGQIYGHAHHTLEIGERDERLRKLTRELFPELIVSGGPFVGMKWIAQPFGSALLPKLLGSYESELHPARSKLSARITRPSWTSDVAKATTQSAWPTDFHERRCMRSTRIPTPGACVRR